MVSVNSKVGDPLTVSAIMRVCVRILAIIGIGSFPAYAAGTADPVRVIYVDSIATGAADGSSWANAYVHLQDALDDADESVKPLEIRVAQGVYKPDTSSDYPNGTGDRTARFYLLDDVTTKGGFAGLGSVDPNLRDPAVYETFLSGDLAGDDVSVPDPRDLYTEPTRAENSHVIVAAESCSRSACLDGFVIHSQNSCGARVYAGGVYLSDGNGACRPTIRNCTILDCADHGILLRGASPELSNCTFIGNKRPMYITEREWDVSPNDLLVDNCLFAENCTDSGGGAITSLSDGSFQVKNSIFLNNVASKGGAVYTSQGEFVRCQFLGNRATEGGAIYFGRPGISIDACTYVGNRAETGRALASSIPQFSWISPPSLSVTNSILWDGGSEIVVADNAELDLAHSDIQGYWPGQGNIDIDPCFADPGYWDDNGTVDDSNDDFFVEGDYHLMSQAGRWDPASENWVQDDVTSPCIDAGDPNSPIMDEPFPNGGIINMGAYGGTAEASKSYFGDGSCGTIITGDINGDCRVDIDDLCLLLNNWLRDERKQ